VQKCFLKKDQIVPVNVRLCIKAGYDTFLRPIAAGVNVLVRTIYLTRNNYQFKFLLMTAAAETVCCTLLLTTVIEI
jgi:hypothetical protein